MENTITMNGKDITTITELRENFNISEAIALQKSGALSGWLRELYYESEADAVEPYCFPNWNNSARKYFCSILGVEYQLTLSDDVKVVFENNREKLAEYTTDVNILNNADVVAADQSQLAKLINDDEKEIVLYKGDFSIPISKSGITYYCVGKPKITNLYSSEQYQKLGITVNNITLPIEDNKENEYAFVTAAEKNGYDFFYEKHNELAGYFHRNISVCQMLYNFSVGIAQGSPVFRFKSECESAMKNAVKKLHSKACGYLDPDRSSGFVIKAAEHYSKRITETFEKIENGLYKYCEASGKMAEFKKLRDMCVHAKRELRSKFSQEINDSSYYKMEGLQYFYDQIDIEKKDYSEDYDAMSRFLAHFASGWIEYRYEGIFDVAREIQSDIDSLADTFVSNAHAEYLEYVDQIEKLAEDIGEGIQLADEMSIEDYLAGFEKVDKAVCTDNVSSGCFMSIYKL